MTLFVFKSAHNAQHEFIWKHRFFSTVQYFLFVLPLLKVFINFKANYFRFHTVMYIVHQGLGRQNGKMSLWAVALKSYRPFIKTLGQYKTVTTSDSLAVSKLSLSEAYYLTNYGLQNILKSANCVIENRKHVDWARTLFASIVRVRGLGTKPKLTLL